MKWFLDLKLGTKLVSTFILVSIIGAFIGYTGITSLTAADDSDTILYEKNTVPISELAEISIAFQRIRVNSRDLILERTVEGKREAQNSINELSKKIEEYSSMYERSLMTEDGKAIYREFLDARKDYRAHLKEVENYALSGKVNEALNILDGDGKTAARNEQALIEKMMDQKLTLAKERSEMNSLNADAAIRNMLIISLVGFMISIGLGLVIAKMIAKPVSEVVANIDNADLNSQFNSSRKDEIGDLQRSFDKFVTSIKSTLLQVSESSAAVASASTQISSSTEELAAGAQEQSSQASEVATAVEEMTKTLGETNQNIRKVADGAKDAKESARKGGDVVGQTVSGMKRIAEVVNQSASQVKILGASSDKIGEIIGVIDDIADQTNLLALNAAIEAARAGEQGRGFAVVADEVRKLAERTSKATKEIAAMIRQIQTDTSQAVASMDKGTQEVASGITLAEQAGTMLNDIVGNAQTVADMVGQIAAASEQQSSASEQISKNVEAISTVTQQSASGTQQIARTAEDLNRLTENLQEILSKFNLGGTDAANSSARKDHQTKKPSVPRSKKAVSENGHLVEHY
ncbi:MAG: methyl-accepting chemotaxis protein [Bacteroidetes bacterium]|nr:methyl-accepting chemotaxis protein [Bacteroidota bacterium]